MTMDNPFPSQLPPTPKKPKPKIDLNACFEQCPPFTVGSLVTLAFVTFDIVTDWLVWKRLSSLWIRGQPRYQHDDDHDCCHGNSNGAHLEDFPQFFFYFVTIATVVYIGQVIFFCARFGIKRCRYRSKLDGLPTEPTTLEICSRDLIISIQVVFQDLSLSVLLYYLQSNVTCDFYIVFYNDSVLILSLCATLCCLAWRFVQTVWHWGCCGLRYDYHGGTHVNVIRSGNIVLLFVVLLFVVLNLILVSPGSIAPGYSSALSRKTTLDKWVNKQFIYISIAGDEFVRDNETAYENLNETNVVFKHHRTYHESYYTLVRLRDVIMNQHSDASVTIPRNDTAWMRLLSNTDFHGSAHQADIACEVFSSFESSTNLNRIDFNLGYHCERNGQDICDTHILPRLFYEFPNGTVAQGSTSPVDTHTTNDSSRNASSTYIYSRSNFSSNELPAVIRLVRPVLNLNYDLLKPSDMCDIKLVQNDSLQIQSHRC